MRANRLWESWTGFWFKPTDPTPLCLMRIFAGLLTVYVHVAYCFDLEAFFGPNAWYDQKEANRSRNGIPYMSPVMSWKNESYRMRLPEEPRLRNVVCEFIVRVATSEVPDRALVFMTAINAASRAERDEVVRWFTKAPAERAEQLRSFLQTPPSPEAMALLPAYFKRQDQPDPSPRQFFATGVENFDTLLPTWEKPGARPSDRDLLIGLLTDTTERDWMVLLDFMGKVRDFPAERRREFVETYSDWGVLLSQVWVRGISVYSPWFHVTDSRLLWTIHGLHIFVMVLFTLGMYTRVTAVATWLAALSYVNRAQPYLFGQDTMMNLCLIYLMLSPCGAKWSVDRWMEVKRAQADGRQPPPVQPSVAAGFVLRMFQIHYCLMYLSAGLSKLKGTSWWSGTALFGCLANPEFSPMHVSAYRSFMVWLCNHRIPFELFNTFAAVFTIATEISFPFLAWTRLWPLVVGAAMLLHTGIGILMGLSVFSLFMFCLLIAFIPPATINWMFEGLGGDPDR